jgi:hypothetical protein
MRAGRCANLPALEESASASYLRSPTHRRAAALRPEDSMPLAARSCLACTIVALFALAAAPPHDPSAGFTYRLRLDEHVTASDGTTRDELLLSGRATTDGARARLDVDSAARESGLGAADGEYVLADSTALLIVAPNERRTLRYAFADLDRGMAALAANAPGTRTAIGDVAVKLEPLGAGEPLLGIATTRWRLTQDYMIETVSGLIAHDATAHVVAEYTIAAGKPGLANPFVRFGQLALAAGEFGALASRTADAIAHMGHGVPLEIVATTTSTDERNAVTTTVRTMRLSELATAAVDDVRLEPPADYQLVDVGARARAANARSAQATASSRAPAAKPGSKPASDGASTDDAARAAKEGFKGALRGGFGGLRRRP